MGEPSVSRPLLPISDAQRARETAHATAAEEAERQSRREAHRVAWQCVALTFLGVPLYLWSWHLNDARQSAVVASAAFLVSYAAPFFRWVVYRVGRDEG